MDKMPSVAGQGLFGSDDFSWMMPSLEIKKVRLQ